MKQLEKIKFGMDVCNRLIDPEPVTYDQLQRSLGLVSKQLQKALADLCKAGYTTKTDRGYRLTDLGFKLACARIENGQETTT